MADATEGISKQSGLPPGSLVYTGEKRGRVKITTINYDIERLEEKESEAVEDCFPSNGKQIVTWVNVDGIHKVEIVEALGRHFDLHPLTLEDIVNTGQRPKVEDFTHYMFIVLRMLQYDEKKNEVMAEQVSLVITSDSVVSFQESEGDIFDPIRERLRTAKGRIRKMGADYLVYSLIDAVVDNYFLILEKIGEKIEDLEEELVSNPTQETLRAIHDLKREMIFLRKSVWPLREIVSRLERWETPLIDKSMTMYFRDVYDHTIQVIDAVETFRDILSGMIEIYLSSVSNRMNEVMKVLTIIATIFIPLTLVSGIYGMNFKNMPELESPWGYPLALLIMFAIGVLMIAYFRRKKWL